MAAVIRILAGFQAAVSAYAAYNCAVTIRKLQQYEPATKKAAKYTNKAGYELYKTRTTQASGALATLASLVTSATVCASPERVSTTALLLFSALNVATTLLARSHIAAHWGDKWQVPGVRDFSDAIKNSKAMQLHLAYLAVGWTVISLALGIQSSR